MILKEEHKHCICSHMQWTHWVYNGVFQKCIESACFCKGFKLDNLKYLEEKYGIREKK